MRRVGRWLLAVAVIGIGGAVVAAVLVMQSTTTVSITSSQPGDATGAGASDGRGALQDLVLPLGTLGNVSYEAGDDREESAHTQVTHALGTTDEAARRGERAGFANLRSDDPASNGGRRAEWHSNLFAEPGDEMSYAISFWIPSVWNQYGGTGAQDKHIIFQIHGGISDWSPLFGIQIYDDDSEARVGFYRKEGPRGPDTVLWSQPLVLEQWVDFGYETLWTQRDDGYLRFYRNAELVYEETGVATLPSDATPYAKWGIYGQPGRVLFDEVRISKGPLVWESE